MGTCPLCECDVATWSNEFCGSCQKIKHIVQLFGKEKILKCFSIKFKFKESDRLAGE